MLAPMACVLRAKNIGEKSNESIGTCFRSNVTRLAMQPVEKNGIFSKSKFLKP
jgi:hypothetical protein